MFIIDRTRERVETSHDDDNQFISRMIRFFFLDDARNSRNSFS